MKGKRLAAALAAAVLSMVSPLHAFEWPLSSPSVRASFGTLRDGRFEPGIQLAAEGAAVNSMDSGEIVFVNGPDCPYPSGLGAWVAVAHEGGLVSVYGRMDADSLTEKRGAVASGEALGMTGRSGAASSAGLELMVYDTVKSAWVNPAILLPALADDQKPAVGAAWILRDRELVPLGPGARVRQGMSVLIADFHDASAFKERMAPFSMRVLVSGAERLALSWDTLMARNGVARLFGEGGMSVNEFEAGEGRYRLGELALTRGRAVLELIVSDYARNSRSQSFQISVE